MKNQIGKIAALFFLTFVLVACQKEEVNTDVESSQAVLDMESSVEEMSDDVLLRTVNASTTTTCGTVTFANPAGTFPNTITIDYGADGCTGPGGALRKGQIVVEVSDAYFTPGSVRSLTPQDFSVNGWAIDGYRTVTNLGENVQGQLQWGVDVNTAVTDPNGVEISWTADRTRTLVDGRETEGCVDDVYEIIGNSSGTNRKGREFTAEITVPLVKRMDCRWIVSGVRQVSHTGSDRSRSIDFGNGDCDNKATLTFHNGDQREITLRR